MKVQDDGLVKRNKTDQGRKNTVVFICSCLDGIPFSSERKPFSKPNVIANPGLAYA